MIDLTKITTSFGLLDKETQKALREHGGPYQRFGNEGWKDLNVLQWWKDIVYRVKPAPPKPREIWVNEWPEGLGSELHATKDIADDRANKHKDRIRAVRFIEVI